MGCLVWRVGGVVGWVGPGGIIVVGTLISTVPALTMLGSDDAVMW